jgi:hypothetical protein
MSIVINIHVHFQNLVIQNISQTVGNLQQYTDTITYLFEDEQCRRGLVNKIE